MVSDLNGLVGAVVNIVRFAPDCVHHGDEIAPRVVAEMRGVSQGIGDGQRFAQRFRGCVSAVLRVIVKVGHRAVSAGNRDLQHVAQSGINIRGDNRSRSAWTRRRDLPDKPVRLRNVDAADINRRVVGIVRNGGGRLPPTCTLCNLPIAKSALS